jgi:hypothetical protein
VRFLEEQTDPLFATDSKHTVSSPIGGVSFVLYWNSKIQAAALGCVENHELCVPAKCKGTIFCNNFVSFLELSGNSPESVHIQAESGADFTNKFVRPLILFEGSAYWQASVHATDMLDAQALDAMKKVPTHGISLGLPSNQWEIEAQNLFNISLAQYQLKAFSIARGEKFDEDVPQHDLISDHSCGRKGCKNAVCNAFKIEGIGWKNISLFWFVTLLTFSLCRHWQCQVWRLFDGRAHLDRHSFCIKIGFTRLAGTSI